MTIVQDTTYRMNPKKLMTENIVDTTDEVTVDNQKFAHIIIQMKFVKLMLQQESVVDKTVDYDIQNPVYMATNVIEENIANIYITIYHVNNVNTFLLNFIIVNFAMNTSKRTVHIQLCQQTF